MAADWCCAIVLLSSKHHFVCLPCSLWVLYQGRMGSHDESWYQQVAWSRGETLTHILDIMIIKQYLHVLCRKMAALRWLLYIRVFYALVVAPFQHWLESRSWHGRDAQRSLKLHSISYNRHKFKILISLQFEILLCVNRRARLNTITRIVWDHHHHHLWRLHDIDIRNRHSQNAKKTAYTFLDAEMPPSTKDAKLYGRCAGPSKKNRVNTHYWKASVDFKIFDAYMISLFAIDIRKMSRRQRPHS
jgi:hypothetical protein